MTLAAAMGLFSQPDDPEDRAEWFRALVDRYRRFREADGAPPTLEDWAGWTTWEQEAAATASRALREAREVLIHDGRFSELVAPLDDGESYRLDQLETVADTLVATLGSSR